MLRRHCVAVLAFLVVTTRQGLDAQAPGVPLEPGFTTPVAIGSWDAPPFSPSWITRCRDGAAAACIFAAISTGGRAAERFLKTACDLKDAEGCLLLGEHARTAIAEESSNRYNTWEGSAYKSDRLGARAFTAACEANPRSCASLGTYHLEGWIGQRDTARAIALFQKACSAGDAEGCDIVKDLTGTMVSWPAQQAIVASTCTTAAECQRDCELRSRDACQQVYRLMGEGAVPRYAERACAADAEWGCSKLAKLAERTEQSASKLDPKGTARTLDRMCAEGVGSACFWRSQMRGRDVYVQGNAKWELLTRGCMLGSAGACAGLAIWRLGAGPPNPELMWVLRRGCALGAPSSCATLGEIYAPRPGINAGVAPDEIRAYQLLRRGCLGEVFEACVRLVAAYEGTTVWTTHSVRDPETRAALERRECREVSEYFTSASRCTTLAGFYANAGDAPNTLRAARLLRRTGIAFTGDAERLFVKPLEGGYRAFDLADDACTAGDAESCYLVGAWWDKRVDVVTIVPGELLSGVRGGMTVEQQRAHCESLTGFAAWDRSVLASQACLNGLNIREEQRAEAARSKEVYRGDVFAAYAVVSAFTRACKVDADYCEFARFAEERAKRVKKANRR